MSKVGGAGEFLRTRVKPVVRRGVAKVEPLDRAASRLSARRAKIARLVTLYNVLRRNYLPQDDPLPEGHLPGPEAVDRVEHAAWLAHHTYQSFFNALAAEGDVERAMVSMTRRLINQNDRGRARIIAQVFQRYPDLRPVAEVCLGMCAIGEPMPDEAWTYFNRHDLSLVTQYMAGEYFRFAFGYNPGVATEQMQRVLAGEVPIEANADVWYDIGFNAFAAGCEDITAAALDRADQATADMPDNRDTKRLKRRIAWLRGWLGRVAVAEQAAPAPQGEVPFALVEYTHPNRASISDNLGDSVQTLVTLGNVVRHEPVRFTGNEALARTATTLQAQTPKDRRIHHDAPATVRLYTVGRDTSRHSAVPDGTWTVISDWFVHSLAGRHFDIPLNPKLRPFFVSFQITVNALKSPGTIDYLRRYAPIGCVDWDNVFLLHAAGIPAFFTGELGVTADVLFEPAQSARSNGIVYVDAQGNDPGEELSQRSDAVYNRGLAGNVDAAAEFVRSLRDNEARVVAGDLRTYSATRALRGNVEQRAADPFVPRSQDQTNVSDAEFAARKKSLTDKLAAVLTAILDGRSEDEVYATWREACAADVALAEQKLADVGAPPQLTFDLNVVCQTILERTVVVERTDTSPQGNEMNIEFSLDANYKHQLDIVLDSVVANTARPVRAFVLCRQHGQDDYDRMAKLFPSVSFVWLPTDNVDYGRISGMNKWVTPATMDRTVLPLLLPDVDRMLHFDLDALCMTDIAELYDVDMEGCGIAGSVEPQPWYSSGFETYRRSSNRLRREGTPELARELITRTHSKDRFDFLIFNAGIMVMDLDRMRADDFCGRYLAYVQKYGVNGQVVLNAYVGNNLKDVGPDWNRLMRLEIADSPKIAHWAGPFKPWHKHVYVTGRELWLVGEKRFAERAKQAGLVEAEPAPTG